MERALFELEAYLAVPLRTAGPSFLLRRFMYRKRWVLRFVFWVYMTPSVVFAVVSSRLWSGLDISKHILSLSLVMLILKLENEKWSHLFCSL